MLQRARARFMLYMTFVDVFGTSKYNGDINDFSVFCAANLTLGTCINNKEYKQQK